MAWCRAHGWPSGWTSDSQPRLTLISGARGIRQDDAARRLGRRRDGRGSPGGVGVAGGDASEQPASFWTYVVDRPGRRGARRRCRGRCRSSSRRTRRWSRSSPPLLNELSAVPVGVDLVLDDYHLADGAGDRGGRRVPARAPSAAGAPGDQHPRRPGPAAGPAAGARRAGRGTRGRPPLHPRRGGGVPQRRRRAGPRRPRTSPRSRDAPRAGSPPCSSRRSRCRDATTPPASSPASPGDDRYVVDYLVEEVLGRQPDDRPAPSCSTPRSSTGSAARSATPSPAASDGKAVLESLERSNLFVVPLDDSRHWYRYHHLFADVLRAHLLEERPERGRRTCTAGRPTGTPQPASRCPPSGTRSRPVTSSARPTSSSAAIIGAPPRPAGGDGPELDRRHPGRRRAAPAGPRRRLHRGADVERRLRRASNDGSTTWSGARATRRSTWWCSTRPSSPGCPGAIETYRAALALVGGDPAAPSSTPTGRSRRSARRRPHHRRPRRRSRAWPRGRRGDLEAAHRGYSVAVEGLRARRQLLRRARLLDHARRPPRSPRGDWAMPGVPTRTRCGWPRPTRSMDLLRGTADMLVGLSQVALERDDLAAATDVPDAASTRWASTWVCRRTRTGRGSPAPGLREAEGDLAGAVALLDEAERVYVGDFSPNVRPVPAQRARVLVAQGRLDEALDWAREQHLEPRRRPALRPRVRARHPGADPAAPAEADAGRRCVRRTACSTGSGSPPRRAGGPAP